MTNISTNTDPCIDPAWLCLLRHATWTSCCWLLTSESGSSANFQPTFQFLHPAHVSHLSNEDPVWGHVRSHFRDETYYVHCYPCVFRASCCSTEGNQANQAWLHTVNLCWLMLIATWQLHEPENESLGHVLCDPCCPRDWGEAGWLLLPRSSVISIIPLPTTRQVSMIFCKWLAAALHSHHPLNESHPAPRICEKNACSTLIFLQCTNTHIILEQRQTFFFFPGIQIVLEEFVYRGFI